MLTIIQDTLKGQESIDAKAKTYDNTPSRMLLQLK